MVQRTAGGLSRWLGPTYGRGLVLRTNLDHLDALSGDRDAQWTRLQATTFLTDDEKRALVGYGPKPAELAHKYNPDQPRDERGRWEDGGGGGGRNPFDKPMGAGGPKQPSKPPATTPSKPTPPQQPPPSTTPQPTNPPKPMADILNPGGKPVGQQFNTNKDTTRTVSKAEYDNIRKDLLEGATPGSVNNYSGTVYTRSDGTIFGERTSKGSGPTKDIFKSNDPNIDNGFKVHQR